MKGAMQSSQGVWRHKTEIPMGEEELEAARSCRGSCVGIDTNTGLDLLWPMIRRQSLQFLRSIQS